MSQAFPVFLRKKVILLVWIVFPKGPPEVKTSTAISTLALSPLITDLPKDAFHVLLAAFWADIAKISKDWGGGILSAGVGEGAR